MRHSAELVDAFASLADSDETQMTAAYDGARARQLLAEGDAHGAAAAAELALGALDKIGINSDPVKFSFPASMEAAAELGDLGHLDELIRRIEAVPTGLCGPALRAQASRFRGRLAASKGSGDPEGAFKSAAGLFRELGTPFWLGVTLFEYGEWLGASDRAEAATLLLSESRDIFQRLRATPWLERLDRAAAPARA